MSDLELIDAVAHITGETQHEIRRRGFVLTAPRIPVLTSTRNACLIWSTSRKVGRSTGMRSASDVVSRFSRAR